MADYYIESEDETNGDSMSMYAKAFWSAGVIIVNLSDYRA